jgi:hypothetical protein
MQRRPRTTRSGDVEMAAASERGGGKTGKLLRFDPNWDLLAVVGEDGAFGLEVLGTFGG